MRFNQQNSMVGCARLDVSFNNFLNAFDTNVALIVHNGVIVVVNNAWGRFAAENGGDLASIGEGVNHLEACRNSSDRDGNAFYGGSLLFGCPDDGMSYCTYERLFPASARSFSGLSEAMQGSEGVGTISRAPADGD